MGSIRRGEGSLVTSKKPVWGIEEMVEGEAARVASLGRRAASDSGLRQFGFWWVLKTDREDCQSHRAW